MKASHVRSSGLKAACSRIAVGGLTLLLGAGSLAAGAPSSASGVPVLVTRFHTQCPMAGTTVDVRTLRSPQAWADTLTLDETQGVGRPVQWRREQVLVYAMGRQSTLGVSIEPASRTLTLRAGVLTWPVRELRPGPGEMAATALSRPCLLAVIKRNTHQSVRVVRR